MSQAPQFMNMDQALAGLNDAKVDDRYPHLKERSKYLLKVTKCDLKVGHQSGLTFIIEHEIVQSDNLTEPAGAVRVSTITGLDDRQNGKFKMGKLKNFLASVFHMNPEDNTQDWIGGAKRAAGAEQIAGGRYVWCQTDPQIKTRSGFDFIPQTFFPYVG